MGCCGVEVGNPDIAVTSCISTPFNTAHKTLQGKDLTPIAGAGLERFVSILFSLLALGFCRFCVPSFIPSFGIPISSLDPEFTHTGGKVAFRSAASTPPYSIELETPGNLPVSSGVDTVSLSDHQPVAILSDGSHNIERSQS